MWKLFSPTELQCHSVPVVYLSEALTKFPGRQNCIIRVKVCILKKALTMLFLVFSTISGNVVVKNLIQVF